MKFMIMPTRQYPCSGGMPLGSKTVGLSNGDYGFLVRGADGKPVAMKSASDNGSGGDPDPLCEYCPGSAHLAENYRVTISGFPAVCNVGTFNGTWTVSCILDCTWQYDITAYHRLTLYFNGTSWEVHWRVTAPGGAYGHFLGTPSGQCNPTACTYAHAFCFEPMFCWNLCSGIAANGVIAVSNV